MIKEMQKFTAISKYAKWIEEKQRREVWEETAERYIGMMVEKHPSREGRIRAVGELIKSFEVMPSMRGLQFGGPPVFKHNARQFNCTFSYCDRLRFFQESFYLLLCGSGVGFSVQDRHVCTLPKFSKKRIAGVKLPKKKFVVTDDIEGWANTSGVMLSSYHEEPINGFADYHDAEVVFDYSKIRDKGALLSFGIGRAPGPIPLRNANIRNRELLNRCLAEGNEKLNSIYAYDYAMHDSDAVISGGVRRSALIVLFDLWDQLMMTAKTGNWRKENPQRARSNNSVMLIRNKTDYEAFYNIFKSTKEFGEPGFYWADHPDSGCNPCVEQNLYGYLHIEKTSPFLSELLTGYQGPKVDEGDTVRLSGFEGCNLSSINGSKISSEEDFYDKCRAASDIGTWQAAFTDFPYLGRVTEEIFRKESLLGVSICGIMHKPEILLNPDILSKGAKVVIDQNRYESARVGINQAARTTCVKPDGNLGSVLGSFPGVHPGKFTEGIRYVQVNKGEPPYQHFRGFNSHACVESVWSENKTDDNIRFPVKYKGIMESDLTATEFLEHVRVVQNSWVKDGKVQELCVKPWLINNVSNTVRVRDHEWQAVADKIFFHQNDYSGVSFIGAYGDRDFPQAPFTTVLSYDQILAEYGSICTSETVNGLIRDAGENLWNMSDTAIFGGKDRWSQHVVDLAKKWFGGNVKKCTYMLKDIYNRRVYDKLMENFVEVDYSKMVEVVNQVQFSETLACAGGACEM